MKGRRPQRKRGLRPARASGLATSPKGRRLSGQVPAGKAVDLDGPREIVQTMVAALRARGDIDHVTQRFHTYPARLHPEAARLLLGVLEGRRLLDPFCGGGTILVEGMLAGRHTWGNDLNPVAVLVARARTRLLAASDRKALHETATAVSKAAAALAGQRVAPPEAVKPLEGWYDPAALHELSALHQVISSDGVQGKAFDDETRRLLRALHSSLVVKYSQRASDTSARRRPAGKQRRVRKGAELSAFTARSVELTRMLDELARAVPEGTPPARLRRGDARAVDGTFDLVVTSPPYPGTYDYLPLQHLRLAWLDQVNALSEQHEEIGARKDFKSSAEQGYERWRRATQDWTMATAKALAPGGHLAVVVGDGISHGRLLEARSPTVAAAETAALSAVAAASIERADPATGLAKREHVLVFRRPGAPGAVPPEEP